MPSVRTDDDVSIAYRSIGSGPDDVVLLHAWGTTGESFLEVLRRLDAERVRATAVDLRGHGASEDADALLTIERLTADVLAVIDDLGADRVVVVGESMGGKLAQHVAITQPQRVAGLVLVSSAPAGLLSTPPFVRRWLDLAGDGAAFVQQVVDPALHQPVAASTRERLRRAWETIPRRSLERTLDLVASTSFEHPVRAIDAPTLVVTGAHDTRHGTHAERLLDDLPHARHVVLDAGGEISAEAPSELAALIHQLVAEVGRPC